MDTSWDQVNAQIAACSKCPLCEHIHHKVPGQGNPNAKLMFIGEGPGQDEDLQGLAFVGRAGQLLTKMIAAMNMTRDEVFICNIVKCRPPMNRVPEPQEAQQCLPYLRQQFALVRPKVVVLLGATAARYVLGDHIRITRDRGNFVYKKGVWFMPTYHPSALLRDESKKKDAWHDLKQVMQKLEEIQRDEGTAEPV